MIKIKPLIQKLLQNLDERKRSVLVGRFGLDGKEAETLQAIGDKYGITRERVRQIESLALSDIRGLIKGNKDVEAILASVNKEISALGGVAKEETLLERVQKVLGKEATLQGISFLREASKSFGHQVETDEFYPFWHNDEKAVKAANQLIGKVEAVLKEKKEEVLEKGKFGEVFAKLAKSQGVAEEIGLNFLSVSKKFSVSPYGDFGLSEWTEVNPATIRDWSYLVLKKEKQPLHFGEIAKKISLIHSKKKKVFTPTVHNELIKDQRFVLVGRGIYGLAEFGYEAGGIKDLIKKILKSKAGLKTEEIVKLVNEQRMFKKNTIILHLQDRKIFKKDVNGKFFSNEA
ncbi:MAG: sigma factor-like helix-turn-helix DNA-binding protein [Candidatus Paceibacterota bacterium]